MKVDEIMEKEKETAGLIKTDESNKYNTPLQCFMNLMKSMVGIVILDLPYLVQKTGYIWSSVLMAFMSMITLRTNYFLLEVADTISDGPLQYGEITKLILGPFFGHLSNIFLIFNQVGICMAYVVFFGRFFQFGTVLLGLQIGQLGCMTIAFIMLLPNVFVKSVAELEKMNLLGVLLASTSLIAIVIFQSDQLISGTPAIGEVNAFNFGSTFLYISVCFTAIEGNLTILPIRSAFENKKELKHLVFVSITLFVAMCILFSVINSLVLGNQIQQIILFNLPTDQVWSILAIIIYACQIMLTYPIQMSPVHHMIDSAVQEQHRYVNVLIKIVLMFMLFLVAYFLPSISGLLGIMGSVFGSSLQFFFPVIFHFLRIKGQSLFLKGQYLGIIIIATLCLTLGLYQSIQELLNKK